MRPPETVHWLRAVGGVVVLLCLALLGIGAQATTVAATQVMWIEASIIAPQSMPEATDCMPCVICYIAPTPSTHGFSGESKEAEAPAWRIRAVSGPPTSLCDTGNWHAQTKVQYTSVGEALRCQFNDPEFSWK